MASRSSFAPDAVIRRVHREAAVAFSGPRSLLMMAADPVAFEGFFRFTGALEDPYARLRRTAQVMDTILWGDADEAERLCARVRAMHARVRGKLREPAGPFPAGTPYAADDPRHLLWILACIADSAVLFFERYVQPLSADERDAYWRDFRVIGAFFGLRDEDMPASWEAFRAYMDERLASDELVVTDTARDLALEVVLHPPVPPQARPVLELSNFVTIGLLPRRLRRQYGLWWGPARALALHGGAQGTRRVLRLLPERLRFVPPARAAAAAG